LCLSVRLSVCVDLDPRQAIAGSELTQQVLIVLQGR
jgi:hypothetical protein